MADNVFLVRVVQSLFGSVLMNTLHFSGPSSDPAQMAVLAQEIETDWIGQCKFKQTGNLKYIMVEVRLLESQFPVHQRVVNINGVATANGGDLPFHAYVLRMYTNIIGKHGRGRKYIGGVQGGTSTNGFITQSLIDQWNISRGVWLGKWGPTGTSTFRLGITRRVNPGANFNQVQDIKVSTTWGIQRRRNIGIGI